MTYKEFLDALSKVEFDWELRGGCIRCGDMCPISALTGLDAVSYDASAGKLGLKWTLAEHIAEAADDEHGNDPYVRRIRRDLLLVCGLEEQQ